MLLHLVCLVAVLAVGYTAAISGFLAFELRFGSRLQHVIKLGTFPPSVKRTRKPKVVA